MFGGQLMYMYMVYSWWVDGVFLVGSWCIFGGMLVYRWWTWCIIGM